MMTPDVTSVMERVAQSKEAIRKSRRICATSQQSLVQGRRALAAANASHAQMRAALAVIRQGLS